MHPVQLTSTDDLRRNRWTVGFRVILAIPHLIWISLWTIAVVFLVIAQWFIALVSGTPSASLHRFFCLYVRYSVHLGAYLRLAANPYPGFVGEQGSYPVDVELPEPGRQNRWKTGFRLFLALPAGLISAVLGGGFGFYAASARAGGGAAQIQFTGAGGLASFFGWWACVFTGRMPQGLRNVALYSISYATRLSAYGLLITDVYPDSDPLAVPVIAEVYEHPVSLKCTDDGRRSRVTVLFRLALVLPHIIWASLWQYAVLIAVIVNWFVTLATGSPAQPLHRFTSAWLRYLPRVVAYGSVLAEPFPHFLGRGEYPLTVTLPGPARQNRWKTGFRLVLVIPAYALTLGFEMAWIVVAFLGWWASLFTGRMPRGMRNLGVFWVRYYVQLIAYLYLLTDVYPYSGPAVEGGGAAPSARPQPADPNAVSADLGLSPERPSGI